MIVMPPTSDHPVGQQLAPFIGIYFRYKTRHLQSVAITLFLLPRGFVIISHCLISLGRTTDSRGLFALKLWHDATGMGPRDMTLDDCCEDSDAIHLAVKRPCEALCLCSSLGLVREDCQLKAVTDHEEEVVHGLSPDIEMTETRNSSSCAPTQAIGIKSSNQRVSIGGPSRLVFHVVRDTYRCAAVGVILSAYQLENERSAQVTRCHIQVSHLPAAA
ncbi:uncharacterized protein UV8b_07085 [Ustilaginoidea virens]|uniref:Uncharacterized protein n=1 Tax=Ustilaginoidea virens TaxID=1159556 RepID=A0A8E5HX32_USTVR|nr:uncharacterized protein UV8b_07085 [Ustilaginoidea virens]QUC22844.1 hypothetical protein UV8b_07085 [Ustilaginoidea virens]